MESIQGKRHPTRPYLLVTEDGRVFRELTPTRDGAGYHTVNINGANVRRHTLVAETYVGARPEGKLVRHLDGDNSNDHHINLDWGTQSDNMADAIRHGRTTRGSRNAQAKLSEGQAREAKRRALAGESTRALALEFRISETSISDLKAGRTWKHLS